MPGLASKIMRFILQGENGNPAFVDSSGNQRVSVANTPLEVSISDGVTVTYTPFTLTSTTSWTNVVTASGGEMIELRIFGISNSSASVSNVAFRFGTNSAFFDQPIPAAGGGYNQNCIGAYNVGGDGENLQVMSGTSVDSIYGHVVTRTIS